MRFPFFIVGVLASQVGDWLTTVAVGVVLLDITGSSAAPAAYIVLRTLPRVVGPLAGGLVADRFRADRALGTALMLQGGIALGLVAAVNGRSAWAIYVVVAGSQLVGSVARPMQQTVLVQLVEREHVARAAAIYATMVGVAMTLGPTTGVVLLRHSGPGALVAGDAASFVVAALLMVTVDLPARVRSGGGLDLRLAAAGLGAVSRDPVMRTGAAVLFAGGLAVGAVQGSLVVMAADRFGGADVSGLLYAAVGAGDIVGGVLLAGWTSGRVGRDALFASLAVASVSLGALAGVHAIWLALGLLAVSATATTAGDVWSTTALAVRVREDTIGRASAVLVLAAFLGLLTGALGATVLDPLVGWSRAILVLCTAAITVAFAVAITAPRDHRLGRLGDEAATGAR